VQQVCYLAPERDLQRLDGLFNELDIIPICYSTDQVKSLTAFVSREKTLNQQNFIILDLAEAEYSQEHILSAVQTLRRFSVADLIFISPDDDVTTDLYGKLATTFRVKRLIKLDDHTDYTAEMRKMLTARDEDLAYTRLEAAQNSMLTQAKKVVAPVTIPPGLVVKVAVAGTMPRVGATTQAFALYHYFKSIGFQPVIHIHDEEMMSILMALYGAVPQESGSYVIIRGIPFSAKLCEVFNCYIHDLSVITPNNAPQLASSDIAVLVTGVKPWELTELGGAMAHLKEYKPNRLATIASFAGDQDLDSLAEYLGKHYAAAPYHPDIWSAGTTAVYQEAILPLVKDYCGDKS